MDLLFLIGVGAIFAATAEILTTGFFAFIAWANGVELGSR